MNRLPNFDDLRKLFPAMFVMARALGIPDAEAFKQAERAYRMGCGRDYLPASFGWILAEQIELADEMIAEILQEEREARN